MLCAANVSAFTTVKNKWILLVCLKKQNKNRTQKTCHVIAKNQNIFLSIAQECHASLIKFLTDKLMLPFLEDDLFTTLKCFLQGFVTDHSLKEVVKLFSDNFRGWVIHNHASVINIGFDQEKDFASVCNPSEIPHNDSHVPSDLLHTKITDRDLRTFSSFACLLNTVNQRASIKYLWNITQKVLLSVPWKDFCRKKVFCLQVLVHPLSNGNVTTS